MEPAGDSELASEPEPAGGPDESGESEFRVSESRAAGVTVTSMPVVTVTPSPGPSPAPAWGRRRGRGPSLLSARPLSPGLTPTALP